MLDTDDSDLLNLHDDPQHRTKLMSGVQHLDARLEWISFATFMDTDSDTPVYQIM